MQCVLEDRHSGECEMNCKCIFVKQCPNCWYPTFGDAPMPHIYGEGQPSAAGAGRVGATIQVDAEGYVAATDVMPAGGAIPTVALDTDGYVVADAVRDEPGVSGARWERGAAPDPTVPPPSAHMAKARQEGEG